MSETFITRVIGGGRLTIPKDVRISEKLHEGDYVKVSVKYVNPDEVEITMEDRFKIAKARSMADERKKLERGRKK